jgi:glutamate-1-semialdehyde aminotransferase
MLRHGVALAPGAYEILFVSLAHSDEDLTRAVEIAALATKEVVTA